MKEHRGNMVMMMMLMMRKQSQTNQTKQTNKHKTGVQSISIVLCGQFEHCLFQPCHGLGLFGVFCPIVSQSQYRRTKKRPRKDKALSRGVEQSTDTSTNRFHYVFVTRKRNFDQDQNKTKSIQHVALI